MNSLFDTVHTVTPTDHPNQRNFKVNNNTQDLVLVSFGGIVYLNSSLESSLLEIVEGLNINTPEYSDISGKSRQYDRLNGFLLRTDYKNVSGAVRSIKTMLQQNSKIVKILIIHT